VAEEISHIPNKINDKGTHQWNCQCVGMDRLGKFHANQVGTCCGDATTQTFMTSRELDRAGNGKVYTHKCFEQYAHPNEQKEQREQLVV